MQSILQEGRAIWTSFFPEIKKKKKLVVGCESYEVLGMFLEIGKIGVERGGEGGGDSVGRAREKGVRMEDLL